MNTLLKTQRWALVALVVGFLLGAYAERRYDTRTSVPVAVARERTRVAVAVAARADTVWRTDTLRVTRTLTRYETARARDTVVVVRDSGAIPVVYVRAAPADSAVQACRMVVRSCASALAARDSVIGAQRAEIRAIVAERPSLIRRVMGRAAWLGAGYVIGRAGIGRGVTIPTPF